VHFSRAAPPVPGYWYLSYLTTLAAKADRVEDTGVAAAAEAEEWGCDSSSTTSGYGGTKCRVRCRLVVADWNDADALATVGAEAGEELVVRYRVCGLYKDLVEVRYISVVVCTYLRPHWLWCCFWAIFQPVGRLDEQSQASSCVHQRFRRCP
jgi:hypothetical protein